MYNTYNANITNYLYYGDKMKRNRIDNFYVEQINKVQDYIERHLDTQLSVEQLAHIASFSKYHFQRIFTSIVGESLHSFIKRLRLEKAAYLLLTDSKRSIQDIALTLGFANQASFAKAFKERYGISSSLYRKEKSKMLEADIHKDTERMHLEPEAVWVKNEEPVQVIYIRYTGPYKGNGELFINLFSKLYYWADDNELINKDTRWYTVYHDFGDETEEETLRLSVCMSVNQTVSVSDDVGIMTIPEGKYAVGRFRVNEKEYEQAWQYMYGKWLPNSGYKPDERFSFEYYPITSEKNEKRLVDIFIPIERM